MLDERQMGDLMLAEVESTETPSRVLDVDRAMSTARRQRRAARGTGAVLLAAALTVGALTVPDLLTPDRPPATMPSGDAGKEDAGKEAVTGLPAALTTVDPARVYVRFGWLPAGMRDLQYQAGLLLGGPGVYLSASSSHSGDGPRQGVAVTLYPQGLEPPAPQRDSGEPATVTGTSYGPELNGAASSFVAYSGAEAPEAILRWRYAPDGWAQLRLVGPAAATDTAARVARSLRFDDGPVQLPGKVAGVPAGLRLITVNVSESLEQPGYWYASTQWSPEPASAEPGRQRARTLSVSISRYRHVADPSDKAYVDPNTTVDGHPAKFGGQDGNESLTVYDVNGATVTIDDDALLPAGGTRALFRAVTLVPEPATWHTHLGR
ncbi:hypothetical protein [Micromonospora cremea]|uniref:Uncharacterized protein n=1 Tax=Micromonospora cremea TaxID=709881 RepID=A0A1N6ADU5_9ACTN|nr:hypothetical protein [Micromonospora cremea]SIN32202.1 hypothetical protein SAMN04489832_5355 [Micromonospora cremea]